MADDRARYRRPALPATGVPRAHTALTTRSLVRVVEAMTPITSAARQRPTRMRFTRPLTDAERDVLVVAAELTRASWDSDLPPGMHERMQSWGQRLKADYDAITGPIRVRDDA